ncbi:MAG: SDR family NAD(P)-dependent oxidoreductase [Chloroflexi bacterium]|nr:SDR family NAD(P)-dependent oxidoreductase [Chloroflexota bacterium]MCC6893414.1 SDR family NAD(P)-dependent oxidoreductase [Anaerolineae bacterium]
MGNELRGKVAVVTGSSRGVGKGVALSLGEAGATVYVVGRTDANHQATVPLAGTVELTAEEVTQMGGMGIAARADLRDDAQIEALFKRVEDEQGRLDILVNAAWAGYEGLHTMSDFPFNQYFWERRLSYWDDNLFAVRAAFLSSVFAARIMSKQGSGLIANISAYAVTYDEGHRNAAYFNAKISTERLIADIAVELRPFNVTAVALWPGLVRTEGIMLHEKYMDLSNSESAQFTGRAVVALAAAPNALTKSGQSLWVSDLAQEYNFTDIDGRVLVPTWKPK